MKITLKLCNYGFKLPWKSHFDTGQSGADQKEGRDWTSLAPDCYSVKYCELGSG